MNFKRIFLVKCLLLLFPSVKCSSNTIYMAVNESALLSLAAAAGNVYEATWSRGSKKLLQIKDGTVKYYVNKAQCRCKVFPNGTLLIQHVVKEDSGRYTVTVYERNGILRAEENTQFTVQELVPQPVLSGECRNKTLSVKCEVKQTTGATFTIEIIQNKSKIIQKNATRLELRPQHSGTFRCVAKNEVSEKTTEKVITCSGQLDLYLILSIAGGAVFFLIFVILLVYCIRKKTAERLEDDDEEQRTPAHQVDSEMLVREFPKQSCVQQRPLPQPETHQPALTPRPRPRTQQRTPNCPKERPRP